MKDLYRRLNLDRAATTQQIRAAVTTADPSIRADAERVLLDPPRRREYDRAHRAVSTIGALRARLDLQLKPFWARSGNQDFVAHVTGAAHVNPIGVLQRLGHRRRHEDGVSHTSHRALRWAMIALLLYPAWLALMAVHESGHVLHAWLSGGRVAAVHFGLFEFSRTDLAADPHPQFVAWGGPVWGSLIPLALLGLLARSPAALRNAAQFFAGLCLIVNGAYIGVGWLYAAGDAATLQRHGAPPWSMISFGVAAVGAGLYLWHRLGLKRH